VPLAFNKKLIEEQAFEKVKVHTREQKMCVAGSYTQSEKIVKV